MHTLRSHSADKGMDGKAAVVPARSSAGATTAHPNHASLAWYTPEQSLLARSSVVRAPTARTCAHIVDCGGSEHMCAPHKRGRCTRAQVCFTHDSMTLPTRSADVRAIHAVSKPLYTLCSKYAIKKKKKLSLCRRHFVLRHHLSSSNDMLWLKQRRKRA